MDPSAGNGLFAYHYTPYGYPTPTAPVITQQSTSVISHGPVSASVNASALIGEKGHTLGKMVPIRVINPDKKSEYKTYNLRNLTAGSFSSVSGLKNEISSQIGDRVSVDPDFNLGYLKGQTKMWIRDDMDVEYVGTMFAQGNTLTLWCDAPSEAPRKRSHQADSSDSDQSDSGAKKKGQPKQKISAMEERRERVEEFKTELRGKHGTAYTPLQYTLWAEMIAVGTHKGLDNPPQVPMFIGKERKQKSDNEMSRTFTQLAKSVVAVLSPQAATGSAASTQSAGSISPNKVADLRSKYIAQMRELHSLYELGALTEAEFLDQKKPILGQLKTLSPN